MSEDEMKEQIQLALQSDYPEVNFLRHFREYEAKLVAANTLIRSINLSPCDGGSCMIATDADDKIQAFLYGTDAINASKGE